MFFACFFVTLLKSLSTFSNFINDHTLIRNEHNGFYRFHVYCRVIALHYVILHCTGVQQWP